MVAALEDLDITAQPGNPGTDPNASGGVKPEIRLEKAADHMTWWVMSGNQVAVTMTTSFEPLDGGKQTRVTTSVARGDAPDERVSPAFRSPGATSAFFAMAVDGELNKLTAPRAASAETCNALMERFRDENLANTELQRRARRFRAGSRPRRQGDRPTTPDGSGKYAPAAARSMAAASSARFGKT